jgi:hypothetical protein
MQRTSMFVPQERLKKAEIRETDILCKAGKSAMGNVSPSRVLAHAGARNLCNAHRRSSCSKTWR